MAMPHPRKRMTLATSSPRCCRSIFSGCWRRAWRSSSESSCTSAAVKRASSLSSTGHTRRSSFLSFNGSVQHAAVRNKTPWAFIEGHCGHYDCTTYTCPGYVAAKPRSTHNHPATMLGRVADAYRVVGKGGQGNACSSSAQGTSCVHSHRIADNDRRAGPSTHRLGPCRGAGQLLRSRGPLAAAAQDPRHHPYARSCT
eukprot:scaffold184_cov379-Prasinococcus_capsulatus_cf.AAC.15